MMSIKTCIKLKTMISKIFRQTDKDRNGCINFDEFLELLKFMDIQLSYERALNLFASVDPDGSGSLDPREFDEGFAKLEAEVATDALTIMGVTPGKLLMYFLIGVRQTETNVPTLPCSVCYSSRC